MTKIMLLLWTRDTASPEFISEETAVPVETALQMLSILVDVFERDASLAAIWRMRPALRAHIGKPSDGETAVPFNVWLTVRKIAEREIAAIGACNACGTICRKAYERHNLCPTCAAVRDTRFQDPKVILPTLKDFGIADTD